MYNLHVETSVSSSAISFNTISDLSAYLSEHQAVLQRSGVWELENGAIAAQTQYALEKFLVDRMLDYKIFE
jgi:hypothetical protein